MVLDIFIPYWGDPDYMKETVLSVLSQTSDNWRLTVVDDAYPNREIQLWIEQLGHPGIRYFRKSANEGITANYETCVGLASEELLCLLGCDDRMLPNYVETVLAAHASYPEAAIIQPGVEVIDERGQTSRTIADFVKQHVMRPRARDPQILSGERLAVSLLQGDWLYWPSLTFRTDKLRSVHFRPGLPVTQDFALIMDMAFRNDKLLLTDTKCFQYRRHSQSASSRKLLDGSRFAQEREYYHLASGLAARQGWVNARRAARMHLTSRAHALALLPEAVRAHDRHAVRTLMRHVFTR